MTNPISDAETVKSRERATVFPDAPINPGSDDVVAVEDQRIRIRTDADERRNELKQRALAMFDELGRLTFRVDGVDVNMRLMECKICYATVIKDDNFRLINHFRWHERNKLA